MVVTVYIYIYRMGIEYGVWWKVAMFCLCVSSAVLRGYAQEVESSDRRHLRDTPSSFSGHMGAGTHHQLYPSLFFMLPSLYSTSLPPLAFFFNFYSSLSHPPPTLLPLTFPSSSSSTSPGLGPRHYTVHLRAVLLLQFMEHLDKLMYNAYEGSCVTLPPVPKVQYHLSQ